MRASSVRDRIVLVASKFFAKFGFHKTTMGEIAGKIHKAKGALYYYFGSKEELYNEVLKNELDIVRSSLSEIVNSEKGAVEILELYIKTRFNLLSNASNYHETIRADFIEPYSFVDDVRKEFDEFERSQVLNIISKMKTEGSLEFSDTESATNLLLIILKSVEIPLFLQNKYGEYSGSMDEMISILLSSIKSRSEREAEIVIPK